MKGSKKGQKRSVTFENSRHLQRSIALLHSLKDVRHARLDFTASKKRGEGRPEIIWIYKCTVLQYLEGQSWIRTAGLITRFLLQTLLFRSNK